MPPKSERFELRLDSEILYRIDEWRGKLPDLPSRSEAIRRLIEAGLGHPEDEQLFQLARFNVLAAAKTKGFDQALSPAYIYAWEEGVYPIFQQMGGLHKPFASHFRVTEQMMDELSKFLDDRWLAKEVPSFYQLEDHYKVRSGRTAWDRVSLLIACRYMFLDRAFDEDFWKSLLRESDHPTEAKSIIRKFSVDDTHLS